MSEYAKAWRFKHPSPWDYVFFMDNALHQDLGWFWYYWLFTTESVDGSIQRRDDDRRGARRSRCGRTDRCRRRWCSRWSSRRTAGAIKPMANAKMIDDTTAIVTYPVDVWFNGSRTFNATLDFGGRKIDEDHARSGLPVPRSRSDRQRVAARGAFGTSADTRPRRFGVHQLSGGLETLR